MHVAVAVAAAVAIPVAAQHLMVLCGAEHLVRHEALVLGQTGRVHGGTDPNAMIGMMIAAAVLPHARSHGPVSIG